MMLAGFQQYGLNPGPLLFAERPDLVWGLIASLFIANFMLLVLNLPLIGLWVKLLTIPYRYLYPSALFFVCIGVYSTNNDFFQVGETVVIGIFGYILLQLGFHPAPILLGFVLGPRFEENFRRAMLISRGDLLVFVERPISAFFVILSALLILTQIFVRMRGASVKPEGLPRAAE
jgi:putative tricarboxylic transport membrane protein